MAKRILKVAFLGFGNAGQAVAEMLLAKEAKIEKVYDAKVVVTAIATGSKGNLVCAEGVDLVRALDDVKKYGKFTNEAELSKLTTMEIVEQADYDVIAEMTPLNIFTGQPAISHI